MRSSEFITEKWSAKYKRSINCAHPKGFSQRAHCQGRKKKTNEAGDGAVAFTSANPFNYAIDKIKSKIKDGASELKRILQTEGGETQEMLLTLRKIANREQVSPEEKKAATAQFFDILKLVGLGALFQATFKIPFSTEAIYMVAKIINKYVGINILPSSLVKEGKEYDAESFMANALKKAGYTFIGSGYDAQVWMKDEGTVVKILMPKEDNSAHDTFKTFYEFSKKHNLPNLPKFKKVDGEEVYNFKIKGKPFVQYGIEQLEPLSKNSLDEWVVWMFADYASQQYDWNKVLELLKKEQPRYSKKFFSQDDSKLNDYKVLYNTLRTLHKVGRSKGYGWDPHTENIMQRNDGTLVITDPWA